jgi:hypothetical protein
LAYTLVILQACEIAAENTKDECQGRAVQRQHATHWANILLLRWSKGHSRAQMTCKAAQTLDYPDCKPQRMPMLVHIAIGCLGNLSCNETALHALSTPAICVAAQGMWCSSGSLKYAYTFSLLYNCAMISVRPVKTVQMNILRDVPHHLPLLRRILRIFYGKYLWVYSLEQTTTCMFNYQVEEGTLRK